MAISLAPGVFVEEVPSQIKAITGVSTSTAAFIGIVNDTVTSWRGTPSSTRRAAGTPGPWRTIRRYIMPAAT